MTVAETKENVDAAKDFLERHDVQTVECMFADTWGIPRGKRLSAKHFLSTAGGTGFAVANVALTWDMHGVIFPDELRERRDRLSGHARRPRSVDAARRRLARWHGLLHLRHDRPRDP